MKPKRVMTKEPVTPPHLMEKRRKEVRVLKYDLEYLDEKNIKIYYLDEASFTCKDYHKLCWSNKHKNVFIDYQRIPKAVSCSIIIDKDGIVIKNMKVGAFKKHDHWEFLQEFRQILGHDEEVALYLDGLSFHHSKESKILMKALNIYGVKSVAYTPQFMPCEIIWECKKKAYKNQLTIYLSRNPAKDLNLFLMVKELMEKEIPINFESLIKRLDKALVRSVGANLPR